MTRPPLRLAAGAAGTAVALWLIPASVHIVGWPPSGPVRVAMFASLRMMALWAGAAVAAVAGAAVRGRRDPGWLNRTADIVSPLVLLWSWAIPFLPWLPDRAPVLLVLAGPLRWIIAAVAVARALWVGTNGSLIIAKPIRHPRTIVAIVSFACYALLGLRSAATIGFGGDEPHYLVIAHSLLVDRDLDIENNHANRDYRAFFPGELRPDYLRRGTQGELYSIHAPGLPALLVPAYALAGARGAVVTIAAIAAATAVTVFDTALLVASLPVAVATWAAVCLSVPFLPHAWMIYPEMPGALIVAWAVLWLVAPLPANRSAWLVRGAALAVLPWLHTKFVVLLALFALYLLLRLRARIVDAAAFVAPIAVSGVLWLWSFYRMYGVLDPEAPYGSYTDTHVLLENIPRGILGLLFDQKFGLIMYAPIYAMAVAGAWVLQRDRRRRGLAAQLLIAAALFIASTTRLYMWWGGASAPARFLVPMLPMFAVALAASFDAMRTAAGRGLVGAGVAIGIGIAALGVAEPLRLFSAPHGVSSLWRALQNGAPLVQSLPTFTEENWRAPLALLAPWAVAAAVAWLVGWALMRGSVRVFERLASAMFVFFVVGAILVGGRGVSARDRAAVAQAGAVALADDFDPARVRGFDYARRRRLNDQELLAHCAVVAERRPEAAFGAPAVEGPFLLPPGRYRASVWLDGPHARTGDAIVMVGRGVTVAAAPLLSNPAIVDFDLPIAAPVSAGVGVQAYASELRRVDITPAALVARSERPRIDVHGTGPVDGKPQAFAIYVDEHTRPEGSTFWTRGTMRSSLVIAPAGAAVLRLTLRSGPKESTSVSLNVSGRVQTIALAPDEIRPVDFPLAANQPLVPVSVESSTAFRPADADPQSADTRLLGCQVRLELR